MRVPHREDIASHSGPEPHGGCGNTMADAWVGGSVGGTLSSEITFFRCRPCRLVGKAISAIALMASYSRTRRSRRTLACVDTSSARIERSGRPPTCIAGMGESSRQKTPGASEAATLRREHKTRKQGLNVGWVGEGGMPYVRFIMPPEVGHNIVPKKRANKRKYRPQRSPWREGRD